MRKAICALLILTMVLPLFACTRGGEGPMVVIGPLPALTATPSEEASPVPTQGAEDTLPPEFSPTAAPTEETTPEPSPEPTLTPDPDSEAAIPKNVDEAIALFEAYPIDYIPVFRSVLEPNGPIRTPRYTQGEDGVYRSSSATGDNEAVIYCTGDIMCQGRQQLAAATGSTYNFEESFDYVRDVFAQADFVIGNLEGTFCETAPYMSEQAKVEDTYQLNAPSTFVEAVSNAGFDMVVMSNNHNVDCGVQGIYDSLDRVDQYKLMHTGLFRNQLEPRTLIVDIDGIKVGIMSYSTFFNRKEWHYTELGMSVLMNPYSQEVVKRDVEKVKADGAEYVIVYIHWGIEYTNDPGMCRYVPAYMEGNEDRHLMITIPLTYQYGWAQEIADAGVDYIIGSHTHSLQPYDVITSADGRSVPVIYSMGNFLAHQKKDVSQDSMILKIVLGRDSEGRVVLKSNSYIPCHIFEIFMGKDYTVVPITKPYSGDLTSRYFAPAYDRIKKAVGSKLSPLGWLG